MLSKNNRLKKRKDFEEAFEKGNSFFAHFFMIKVRENNLNLSRFAFVVPVKNEKKANKRNRLKRVFREAVRSLFPLIKKGFDVIFIIKKEAQEKSFDEIKKEIEMIFKKGELI